MYDNNRGQFGPRQYRSDDDRQRSQGRFWRGDEDRGQRSRSGYDPYRQDAQRGNQWRDDGPAYHDHDEEGFRSTFDRQSDNRQSDWFTGSQNSWAVPPVRSYGGGGTYGGSGNFGRDYRDHGYADRDYDRSERGFFAKAGDEVASWFGDEDAARRREADHRGRGPKDYVRSDDRIRDDANDRLTEDWRVDASNITVMVEKGEVTLNGTVTARDAKRRAEDIVEDISGVKHVQNNLRVAQTASSTGGAYDDNWALNQRSTAEGGTLGKDATPAKH